MHSAHSSVSERLQRRIGKEPLAALIGQPLAFNHCLYICLSLCRAIVRAHRAGYGVNPLDIHAVFVDPDGVVSFGESQTLQQYAPADIATKCLDDSLCLSQHCLALLAASGDKDPHCYDLLNDLFQQDHMPCATIEQQLLQLYQGRHLSDTQHTEAAALVDTQKMGLLDVLETTAHIKTYLFHHHQHEQNLLVIHILHNSFGYSTLKQLVNVHEPHLASIHAVSRVDSGFIVIQEYLPGGSLAERIQQPHPPYHYNPLPLASFLLIARQLVAGLERAHEYGILHGNLSATTVYYDDADYIHLTDFGVAAATASAPATGRKPGSVDIRYPKKRHWYPMLDEPLSEVTDIFGCGLLFYQLLIGDEPRWRGRTFQEGRLFNQLPDTIRRIMRTLLQLTPSKRYQTMGELKLALADVSLDAPKAATTRTAHSAIQLTDKANPVGERKKVLFFLLLVLFFIVCVNMGILLTDL